MCLMVLKQRYTEFMRKLAARRRKATDINVAIAEIDCDPEVPLDRDTIRAALKTCAPFLLKSYFIYSRKTSFYIHICR